MLRKTIISLFFAAVLSVPVFAAYDFDGTDDRIDIANVWDNAGTAQTISMWVYPDAVTATVYFFTGHATGDASLGGCIFFIGDDSDPTFTCLTSGTDVNRSGDANELGTGSWQHLLVTWDGSLTVTNVHIYLDGTELTSYASASNGDGTFTAAGGSHSFGGRITDDARNFDGRIAEPGHWDRVLGAGEIAILAARYSPLFIPNGLRIYPLQGMARGAPHNYITGATATIDQAVVIAHPPIIRTSGPQTGFAASAVGSGSVPAILQSMGEL